MIDGLRAKLTQVDVASQKNAKAATAGTSPASSGPIDQLFAESATVEVSSVRYSGQKAEAPIDRSKVDRIRDAIRNNSYPVDFQKLADRMLEVDFASAS
jgi:flagellar biosynthesis anti-sigma factor FlgM